VASESTPKDAAIPPHEPSSSAMNVQARIESVGQHISRKKWLIGLGFAIALILFLVFRWSRSDTTPDTDASPTGEAATGDAKPPDQSSPGTVTRVDVVRPRVGGMIRTITEPGTVKAFDYADLYAKVSGFLEVQSVDIGDSVKPGQLLAKIFAPELAQAVEQAKAQLDQAKAQVSLAEAAIDRAQADLKAAKANVDEKQADLKREKAYLAFRQIQYERIKNLYELRAIEEKLVDQNVKERDAAREAENAAKAAIETANAEVSAKKAKIVEATAELSNAKAKVQVAEAELAKARVFVDYLEIRSPYLGVITKRTFHVGDFIRTADQGGGQPILVVARTDKMRVVMKMPESEVPYTDAGDPATVDLDALAGKEFPAKVSRIGNSLDPTDRTMRVEVDLENTSNELRDGMFGRVTVQLSRSPKEVSIPSTCLLPSADGTTTSVYVVGNGELKMMPVKVGRDNGVQAEILSGLRAEDLVVRHPTADLYAGEKVSPVETPNNSASQVTGKETGAETFSSGPAGPKSTGKKPDGRKGTRPKAARPRAGGPPSNPPKSSPPVK
jgi:HlyD family secretion protein